jgi:hypothetical protein
MKAGTEDRKKVAALTVLGLVAAYLVYSNVIAGGGAPPPSPAPSTAPATTPMAERAKALALPAGQTGEAAHVPQSKRAPAGRPRGEEFHPVFRSKRPEDQKDPLSIDPTLLLDRLAKLQAVTPESNGRNLFQFGQPAAKELPKGPEPVIAVVRKPMGPPVYVPPPPPPPPAPPAPLQTNLKYYGIATRRANGKKTACFLDGEEIILASEGETVKKRYKVLRIGVNSVVMEETDSKRQQTLPLAEDAPQNATGE